MFHNYYITKKMISKIAPHLCYIQQKSDIPMWNIAVLMQYK